MIRLTTRRGFITAVRDHFDSGLVLAQSLREARKVDGMPVRPQPSLAPCTRHQYEYVFRLAPHIHTAPVTPRDSTGFNPDRVVRDRNGSVPSSKPHLRQRTLRSYGGGGSHRLRDREALRAPANQERRAAIDTAESLIAKRSPVSWENRLSRWRRYGPSGRVCAPVSVHAAMYPADAAAAAARASGQPYGYASVSQLPRCSTMLARDLPTSRLRSSSLRDDNRGWETEWDPTSQPHSISVRSSAQSSERHSPALVCNSRGSRPYHLSGRSVPTKDVTTNTVAGNPIEDSIAFARKIDAKPSSKVNTTVSAGSVPSRRRFSDSANVSPVKPWLLRKRACRSRAEHVISRRLAEPETPNGASA